MSTVQNILNRTSVVAEAARSTSTGTGFDAVLAGAIRDDRSAIVDRRSQQPGREPVRAEQPDRARTDRTDRSDRSDRSGRADRTDRPRTETADRADRTNTNRTDRTGQTDRPATTDGTTPTDQKTTQTAADGTAAPTVTPVLTDPSALVVATPVEALPALPVPSEAAVAESDVVVDTGHEAATGTDTVPTLPATTTVPVDAPTTPQPSTAQTTTVPTAAAATAVPAETTAPVAESVKAAPANAGPQPATAPASAAQATAQVTAQSTTPAATESTSPATSAPATSTTPTTPVGPAVQVGSVALPTTAVTRESAAPLSDQLAGKLAEQLPGLKAAGPGRHTLSLTVTPEHFGKIQVVAHISAESVRVELVGATDAARDSLRAALPDLRRDLAQSGLSSDVRLGDPNAGTDPRGGQPGLSDSGRRPAGTGTTPGTVPGDRSAPAPESVPVRTASAAGGLDLLV